MAHKFILSAVGTVILSAVGIVILSAVEGWGRYPNRFDCVQRDNTGCLS